MGKGRGGLEQRELVAWSKICTYSRSLGVTAVLKLGEWVGVENGGGVESGEP